MPEKGTISLDEEKLAKVEEMMVLGVPEKHAGPGIGISERLWFKYKAEGKQLLEEQELAIEAGEKPKLEERESLLLQFVQRIKSGRRRFVEKHVIRISVASQKNWTASAWLLERMYPEEFSKTEKIHHSGSVKTDRTEDEIDRENQEIEAELAKTDRKISVRVKKQAKRKPARKKARKSKR